MLEKHKWNVNQSIEFFFANGLPKVAGQSNSQPAAKVSANAMAQLFNAYKDAKEGVMDEEGIDKFFKDLGVDSETDIVTLLASKYMEAATMGTYT